MGKLKLLKKIINNYYIIILLILPTAFQGLWATYTVKSCKYKVYINNIRNIKIVFLS